MIDLNRKISIRNLIIILNIRELIRIIQYQTEIILASEMIILKFVFFILQRLKPFNLELFIKLFIVLVKNLINSDINHIG
jgi:hypothetical protein